MLYTYGMDEPVRGAKTPPAVFKFRFSPLMIALLCGLLALCAASFALTTWQFIGFLKGDISSPYEWLKYILLYLVSVLLFILIAAMLIRSRYVVTDKELIQQFGLIKSKFALSKIYSVRRFQGTHKLVVYFDDFKSKFTVIVVKEAWYDEFVRALADRNTRITYDFTTAEEEQNWKNEKKK